MKTPDSQKYHILVVDDEPSVCQAIKMMLKFKGHEVQTVNGGKAALARLEHENFDLIITDYFMQGMKGDELAAIIKQDRPDQPIIMATAYAADFQLSGRPSGGVDRVLNKPFTLLELREAIAEVMSLNESQSLSAGQSDSMLDPTEVPPPFVPPPSDAGEADSGRRQV